MPRSAEVERVARLCGVSAAAVAFDGTGESGVERWIARLGDSEITCRIHRDIRRYSAEHAAYARLRAAGVGFVPQLLLAEPDERALVLTRVPGRPALVDDVGADQLIAVIDTFRRVPVENDSVSLSDAFVRRRDAVVTSLRGVGEERAADAVCAVGRVADAPRVFSHRDLGLRNLIVGRGSLAVIDFEHAQSDAPECDLLRIELDAPALARALVEHYCLDDASRDRWTSLRIIERGRELAWAVRHRDLDRTREAREFFAARPAL